MDVLFKTIGDKSSIDRILLLCQRKFSDLVPIGRKEFTFVSAEDIAGKFRTYYPFPGWKRFEMLVENANEGQFDEIEEMGNELFAGLRCTAVSLKAKEPANGLLLANILSQQFINALHLNLENNAGIFIRSGNNSLEILNGLRGNNFVAARNNCGLNEKRISQLNREACILIRQVLALSGKMIARNETKRFPMPLKSKDLGWRGAMGTTSGGITSYIQKGGANHYRPEASAGFETYKSNLSNLLSEIFLDTVRGIGTIDALTLEKDTGRKKYIISVSKDNNGACEGITSAEAMIELALGTKRTFDAATKPEVLRLLNAMYVSITDKVDLEQAFMEYILNNANSTCICGKKFENTLNKEIVEIGCYSAKKHLIHRSCWNKWKSKNKPKEFDWNESFCPFCEKDSSVYKTLWSNKRLVWKNIGP